MTSPPENNRREARPSKTTPTTRVIDAHQHFWDLSCRQFDYSWLDAPTHSAIRRSFLPPDLQPKLQEAGVDLSIAVQTQHNLAENDWALSLAESHGFIAGVVGWVDLTDSACENEVQRYLAHPKFVGVRHITQDEPDDNFILRDDVLQGLQVLQRHGVPFDLLFYERHLQHATVLGRRLPDLRMVIDHLAKPVIGKGNRTNWLTELKNAARHANIYCKLSGLITEADWRNWKPLDLKPFIEAALDAFGPQRCMFGSDWPVCELAGSYQSVYDALTEVVGGLSANERRAILGGTATEFYGLETADTRTDVC